MRGSSCIRWVTVLARSPAVVVVVAVIVIVVVAIVAVVVAVVIVIVDASVLLPLPSVSSSLDLTYPCIHVYMWPIYIYRSANGTSAPPSTHS
jgi:hypothetical protein